MNASDPWARLADLPGVPKAVESARLSVDRLLGHRALRRQGGAVTAESAVRGARATAALEGVDWPIEGVRKHAEQPDRAGVEVVRGALRAVGELGTVAATWERAPLQALARLHMLAAAEVLDHGQLGRPRREGEDPADPLGLGAAPAATELGVRLDALAQLVVRRTSAPALVVAAVVHGELLALRPFVWGSGIVARASERLVLVNRGLDPRALGIPEVGHAELAVAYAEAARGYLAGSPYGVAAWIRHCADAVALGAREALAVCEALVRG
jgi:hypothetical protein